MEVERLEDIGHKSCVMEGELVRDQSARPEQIPGVPHGSRSGEFTPRGEGEVSGMQVDT